VRGRGSVARGYGEREMRWAALRMGPVGVICKKKRYEEGVHVMGVSCTSARTRQLGCALSMLAGRCRGAMEVGNLGLLCMLLW
jgi:hypothetical protein